MDRTARPIEIPSRMKPMMSPITCSPAQRPVSPEMVFEMSPLSPAFTYPLGFSTCQSDDAEPLMYSFPVVSPRDTRTSSFVNNPSSAIRDSVAWPKIRWNTDENSSISSSQPLKSPPVQKITGFVPLVNSSSPSLVNKPCPLGRLSPPPNSSFSSSPWILPGSCDSSDDDATDASSPSAVEFDKYLVRHIERQNYLTLRTGHHASSMNIAVRG